MCGRYTLYLPWSEIHRLYSLNDPADRSRNTKPRYNITPTQDVLFVVSDKEKQQKLLEGRWGLVPFWAKEIGKFSTFNAQSEEAYKKSSFREAFKSKRCLIPADGFYEWTKAEDGAKDPWHIFLPDHKPFSFAGLWSTNDALGITSCTILTDDAVEPVSNIHKRMPVILAEEVYNHWIDSDTSVGDARDLLKHHIDGQLEMCRVDRQVNSSRWAGDETAIQCLRGNLIDTLSKLEPLSEEDHFPEID